MISSPGPAPRLSGSRALDGGVFGGEVARRATFGGGEGRRSIRQLVALTRIARASVPASMRRIASSTLIRPRTALTRPFHNCASATLMLTPPWRLTSGSAVARLPLGTSNARSSAADAAVGTHITAGATGKGRVRFISARQHPAVAALFGACPRQGG